MFQMSRLRRHHAVESDPSRITGALQTARAGRRRATVLATLAATVVAIAIPGIASAAVKTVTVSPLPGTPDASPTTQISILGAKPSKIESVTVTGSESGVHSGTLEPYSGEQGASFVLSSPLTPGEEVNVTVTIKKAAPITDAFKVGVQGPTPPNLNVNVEKPEDLEHFVTAPDLHPPKIVVHKNTAGLAGDIFLTPLPGPTIHPGAEHLLEFTPVGPEGDEILNPEGKILWWNQLPPNVIATDLQLTSYEGSPVLAWWQGPVTARAYGLGEGVIANTSYETVATIKAGNGYKGVDIHELQVTPEGNAYVTIYNPVCVGEPCSLANPAVIDAIVQEINIKTGLVMYEWHALGHVPTSASVLGPETSFFDAYHINSIQPLPKGMMLLSFRNTSAIYLVNEQTGQVSWTLGGKESSFAMGPGATFHFQHDARLKGDTMTLYDDEAGPPVYGDERSRGLVLHLNMTEHKATVTNEYIRPEKTLAQSEGNLQSLAGGDVMIGFGGSEWFSEFSKSGEVLFDASLPKGDGSYRVFRFPWSGTPKTLPAAAAREEGEGNVGVYASWNGATEVASWEVLAGESAETLAPVASEPWAGFETKIVVPTTATTFEVKALNAEGHVLSTSEPVPVQP
ncbi:MAG TPA: arylsulfotransferase family protein [Solirubrobacteraceae bacterium]|nr:arylsulfotransferase family protein [Solirubrobacteraceae bacterium]